MLRTWNWNEDVFFPRQIDNIMLMSVQERELSFAFLETIKLNRLFEGQFGSTYQTLRSGYFSDQGILFKESALQKYQHRYLKDVHWVKY